MKNIFLDIDTSLVFPEFSNEKCDYYRKEKSGYFTIRAKSHPELNDLILNGTTLKILNLCNGKRNISEIIDEFTDTYPDIERDIFKKDILHTLDNISKLQLIKWYPENPFIGIYKANIAPDFVAGICTEESIDQVVSSIKSAENESNQYYTYYNPLESKSALRLSTLKKEMYNNNTFAFDFYRNGKLCGLFIFKRSEFYRSHVLVAHYFAINKNNPINKQLLSYMYMTLSSIVDFSVTGLRMYIDDNYKLNTAFMDEIKSWSFFEEGILQKETNSGGDIIVLRHTIPKPI